MSQQTDLPPLTPSLRDVLGTWWKRARVVGPMWFVVLSMVVNAATDSSQTASESVGLLSVDSLVSVFTAFAEAFITVVGALPGVIDLVFVGLFLFLILHALAHKPY